MDVDETGIENLIASCFQGKYDNVKLRLEDGLNPDCSGLLGTTPLIAALSNRHFTLANLLITYGAKVDYKADDETFGQSALVYMCNHNNIEGVEFLLARGANVDLASSLYGTPLKCSVTKGHLSIVTKLLESGANIELKSSSLLYVRPTDTPLCHAAMNDHIEIVMLLISKGAKIKPLRKIERHNIPRRMLKFLKSNGYL